MHIGRVAAVRRCLRLTAIIGSLCLPLPPVFAQAARTAKSTASPSDTAFFFGPCTHDEMDHPSQTSCPGDTTAMTRMVTFAGQDVKEYTLVVTMKNGRTYRQKIPAGTDAIFMSNQAIQKFAIPYYQGVNDDRKVSMLQNFLTQLDMPSQQGRARPKAPALPSDKKP